MKSFLLGVLQKIIANRDARLAARGLAPAEPLPPAAAASPDELLARGEALEAARDFDGALQVYRELLTLTPRSALMQVCAGNALYAMQRFGEAESHYRAAIDRDPAYAAARLNLGNALFGQGRVREAEQAYRDAVRLRPGWVEAYAGLGRSLDDQGLHDDAAQAYREALKINPACSGVAVNLAETLHAAGHSLLSLEVLQDSLTHAADRKVLTLLADRYCQLGEHDEAVARYRQLLAADPDNADVASALLFARTLQPGVRTEDLVSEHRVTGARIAARVGARRPQRVRDPERVLRVGYVSPDFRSHPVAQFIAPVLREHDPQAVEHFCYSNNERDDPITGRLRSLATHWRPIRGLDDGAVAELIEEDRIDLLVDLAGHTSGQRLGVFARRPAPVQLTWLGYLGTTGLPQMDFRICDAHSDPPGAESLQTETPLRLPDTQWCRDPPMDLPPSPLPFLQRGYWTFGSFNQWPKLNVPLLETWGRLMASVPDSRLRIAGVPDLALAGRVHQVLAPFGVAPARIELVTRVSLQRYLEGYAQVDVALDSAPYTGGTTTCDALLMGVPVATVTGERAVERSGVSLLTTLGLTDWIAGSLPEVPPLVRRQISDPQRLAALRAALPARMLASALMDAPRFTRNLEALYRDAWRRWCVTSG